MSKQHGRENDTVAVTKPVEKSEVAVREEAMQAFWEAHDIFNKTIATPASGQSKGDFVFYDGPPFATGLPHYGHILAGTIKDAVPRFWTMNGYRVRRKWGWDCHGLPLENLIEKRLGLANKRDIEEYGIQNFNEAARDAVLEYADDWRRIIPRMGRFVDMADDYKTMDSSYTESVWWVFKTLHEKGLVHEGFKTMHLCPRCGTTLSNFEVNLGYKDIKDIAVTVKLPLLDEAGEVTDTSLLVWTTTPWTLPGNLAAAVNEVFEYVKVALTEEGGTSYVIIAKERLAQLEGITYEVVASMSGADLIGRSYQPPFPWLKEEAFDQTNAWKIWHADYVELGADGTGAVHIAPAYGEDDLVLAQANGIPVVHHVDYEGRFKAYVADFAGKLVKPKDNDDAGVSHLDADIEIVKALKASGALLKKENITHSYPHCWRDDTPLLNYATTSWFVNVPKIKDELLAANDGVHWVPGHVGKNRFGKWLEGARDWAISRQRYWGAPLPIWRNPETQDYKVIGSLNELQTYVPQSGNVYFVMRHGQSVSNVEHFLNSEVGYENPLTADGQAQVQAAVHDLPADIDYVFTSPLQRTRETARIVADALKLAPEQVIEDARIRESGMGELEGRPTSEKKAVYATPESEYLEGKQGMESLLEIRRRMGEFLYELEAKYVGKKILIISHGDPLCILEAAAHGLEMEESLRVFDNYYQNAQVRTLDFSPLPHNDDYVLDYHRPYIDHIDLYEGDVKLERIPDVFDCWFESGSMPYAETHYPFNNLDVANPAEGVRFPANFISESVDQTRGWFYSLLVLGVALFGKSPFENVITNGLVLAEDGKKMSKSLQNYPDPMELADRVGVDAMRFYLLSSAIIRGEDLNFSEKEVLELQRKNIGRLHNVLAMYEMYAGGVAAASDSTHVLDRWIIARLNQLIAETTAGYHSYELDKATRPITDFIDDVSVWYLRRSRDRLKGEDVADKQAALATLRFVLCELSKVMAPVMPFYAEYLYRAVRDEASESESVHLAAWPTAGDVDEVTLSQMAYARTIVNEGLRLRTQANIKVRQPLATMQVAHEAEAQLDWTAYLEVIADEVNVKSVLFVPSGSIDGQVALDTTLSEALVAEGAVRELVRAIQGVRAAMNLEPHNAIRVTVATDAAGQAIVTDEVHAAYLKRVTGTSELVFADVSEGTAVHTEVAPFTVSVTLLS